MIKKNYSYLKKKFDKETRTGLILLNQPLEEHVLFHWPEKDLADRLGPET